MRLKCNMEISKWSILAEKFVNEDEDVVVKQFISGLEGQELSLMTVVECLGPSLTATELKLRRQGIRLLSEIISELHVAALSQQEGHVCLEFMCQRLRDHHSMTPHIVKALNALSRQRELTAADLTMMVRSVFNEVTNQSLTQMERRQVYSMILYILQNRLKDILPLGGDFVFGFVQAIDGEKDPRNLKIAFQCVTLIAKNFDLGVFSEELFEVVSCYFPIEFTPPPNDPHAITQDELVEGLRECLAASATFAEFGYPLFLEKLTSDVKSSKLDALKTLCVCMPVYGPKALYEYTSSILNSIRRTVFMGLSLDLVDAGLQTVTVMVQTLASSEADSHSVISSCRLLEAAAHGSHQAALAVLQHTLSLSVREALSQTQIGKRRCHLDVMTRFLRLAKDSNLSKQEPVETVKEDVFSLAASIITESDSALRRSSLDLLSVLVSLPQCLTSHQLHLAATHLTNTVRIDADESVRERAVSALVTLATANAGVFLETVLPDLTTCLTTVAMETEDHHLTRSFVMRILAKFCVCRELTEKITQLLTQYMYDNVDGDTSSADFVVCCESLVAITSTDTNSSMFYANHLFTKCIEFSLLLSLRPSADLEPVCDRILVLLYQAIQNIMQILPSNNAVQLVSSTVNLYLHGEHEIMNTPHLTSLSFHPLQSQNKSPRQRKSLCVLQAVTCSCCREVSIPEFDLLMSQLLTVSCDSDHVTSATMAAKCFSGLVNKVDSGPTLDKLISSTKETLLSLIDSEEMNPCVLTMFAWLTKALVLRCHSVQSECLLKLCEWLSSERLGHLAAEGLRIVLQEVPDVMTAKQHAIITLLYLQRVFVIVLPVIKEAYIKESNSAVKKNHVRALSYLLQFVPKAVVQPELTQLVPLLVESIHANDHDEDSVFSSLSTLYDLIMESPTSLTKYIDDILPCFLMLASHQSSMKIRMQALRCLGAMTTVQYHTVVKHRKSVVRGLVPLLGDRKRLVRKEAVTARSEWILLEER